MGLGERSGKVDLVPQQPGQFISGPEGSINAGQNNFGVLMGTLMGRIGEKGDVFVIGKRYEAKAARSGKLYVFIVPAQNGQAPSGAFKVKATAGFSLNVNPGKNHATPPIPPGAWNAAGVRLGLPPPIAQPGVIELVPEAAPPEKPAPEKKEE